MPVEIRELVIRAVTTPESNQTNATGTERTPQLAVEDKAALIQECVRQVMRILQKREER
jgi:hypothetical protein